MSVAAAVSRPIEMYCDAWKWRGVDVFKWIQSDAHADAWRLTLGVFILLSRGQGFQSSERNFITVKCCILQSLVFTETVTIFYQEVYFKYLILFSSKNLNMQLVKGKICVCMCVLVCLSVYEHVCPCVCKSFLLMWPISLCSSLTSPGTGVLVAMAADV